MDRTAWSPSTPAADTASTSRARLAKAAYCSLVLPVALEHQLMSRFTSFVAVEEQPVRAADEPLDSQLVPNLNPVDHRLYPQTSLGLTGLWALALALLLAALLVLNWKPRHA